VVAYSHKGVPTNDRIQARRQPRQGGLYNSFRRLTLPPRRAAAVGDALDALAGDTGDEDEEDADDDSD